MKSRTYAFDFDGVVHEYDGVFISDEHVGQPRQDVIEAIKRLKSLGHKILIYSTRSSGVVEKFCKEHNIPYNYINHNPEYKTGNPGKPVASVYVDDRGYTYKKQSTDQLVKDLINFEPHYKKDKK
jgi:adenylylsulfate kinase